jgi:DeoR family deoxyribose operon repressor
MSTRKTERANALADALARRGVLHLRDAAALLGVSEMTVRRDVSTMPDRFTYLGGHIVSADDIAGGYELGREADSHANAKFRACAHALKLIAPDDTVFIDCGSTLDHLAQQIPADLTITVICYSLNVAQRLAEKPHIRMIMLGGIYHPASATFSSGDWLEPLGRFGINKAFISAGGVDVERGASCSHFHEVPIKQKAIASALESYLVVDGSKFGTVKPAYFARLSDFRAIITEAGAKEPAEA